MRWSDWLLGRDSESLKAARAVRTTLWWAGWFELLFGLGEFVLALSQSHGIQQSSAQLLYLVGWVLPFGAWAILTALIEICDRLGPESRDTDDNRDLSGAADV